MAKPKKKPGKASRAEVAARVGEVLRIRLGGAAFHDVVAFAKKKKWNVSERQCGRYLEKADELLAGRSDRKRRRIIAVHLARREALFAKAVNAADYRTGLAVLADLAKLQDLYANDRDLRELLKLTTMQEHRIKDLEDRLRAHAERNPGPTPSPGTPIGSVGDAGTAGTA